MAENMMCRDQKASNKKYREGYDRVFRKDKEGEEDKNEYRRN